MRYGILAGLEAGNTTYRRYLTRMVLHGRALDTDSKKDNSTRQKWNSVHHRHRLLSVCCFPPPNLLEITESLAALPPIRSLGDCSRLRLMPDLPWAFLSSHSQI